MAKSDNEVIIKRRLEVDRLLTKGLSHIEIARKLKVTRRTVYRDVATLDRELQVEPQYSEDRLKARELFMAEVWEQLKDLKQDMDNIRKGGSERTEEDERAPVKDAKEIKDEKEMLDFIKGNKRLHKFIIKTFGPNWNALAKHHDVRIKLLEFGSKLWGLLVDKEIKETEEEIIEHRGVVRLPIKANPEEWQDEADAYAKGDITIALEPGEKPDGKNRSPKK